MADNKSPRPPGREKSDSGASPNEVGDLESRRERLADALAAKSGSRAGSSKDAGSSGSTGFGQALKLSSEFVGGVLVGAGIGYLLDRFAGTAPWGMIVFLLLGFGAGVLNVLRSAGVVADPEASRRFGPGSDGKQE